MEKNKVLVTGISGFIGQHCAVELLKKGYKVRGSLRNLSKKESVINGIKKAIDPKDNLEFCSLDLLSDDGWLEALTGCDYLLHIASPYIVKQPKDENELIKPAVEGTLRALSFATKAKVKRVVLTSSVAAMMGEVNGTKDINEDSWTDEASKTLSAYMKSKTIAEKKAWDFIKNNKEDHSLELAVINPGPVFGPTLTNNISGESLRMFSQMIEGKMPMLPKSEIGMSDVRDIAKTHVLAMEIPEAKNHRFLVTTDEVYSFSHLAKILKSNGYNKVSTKEAPSFLLRFMSLFNSEVKGMLPFLDNTINTDNTLAKKILKWEPIAIEKTVLDTATSIQEALKK